MTVEGKAEADNLNVELSELQFSVVRNVQIDGKAGPNILGLGSFDLGPETGLPAGWQTWLGAKPPLELHPAGPGKNRFLHVGEGPHFFLAHTAPLHIQHGAIYEMSFRARGTATITSFAHPLAPSRFYPLPLRVGDPQSQEHKVGHEGWQTYSRLWFSGAMHTTMVRPALAIVAGPKGVDIDDVQFRKVGE
jgi:hypothetical protein